LKLGAGLGVALMLAGIPPCLYKENPLCANAQCCNGLGSLAITMTGLVAVWERWFARCSIRFSVLSRVGKYEWDVELKALTR